VIAITAIQQLQVMRPDRSLTAGEMKKLLQQFRKDMIRDMKCYAKYGVVAPSK
jgi:hypothetical protein